VSCVQGNSQLVATGITTETAMKRTTNLSKRGVATIIYYGKTKENKMVCKTRLKSGSWLRVRKVLTPYNARPKTRPLIE